MHGQWYNGTLYYRYTVTIVDFSTVNQKTITGTWAGIQNTYLAPKKCLGAEANAAFSFQAAFQ